MNTENKPESNELTEAVVFGQELEPEAGVEMDEYAQSAYLDYAMSVVMGRALPMIQDGQKPVQRRILFDMHRMGLQEKARPVKSARVVGDVLGKYHPHGDSACYEAMVRMAQNFALRYPLVDGQGNFGSRDGDFAAAMRYTEARLTPIAELLLGELDLGTIDFKANYDGTLKEPAILPARLPMLLLNGASGIAVGMATEIASHNLTEVAKACEHLIKRPQASLADILQFMPGPDFPCGGQIISSPEDIAKVYAVGRGGIRVRARWAVEQLARGQWQIAINELPPDTSTAKIMAEIEVLTNPQIKSGKKSLSQDQLNLKALALSVIDRISDDSDAEHPVRLLIEPRSSRLSPDEVMQVLLAHTGLESNFNMNLVTLGLDGKPRQKGLLEVLQEWVSFRFTTVTNRTTHRLEQVNARIHILDGRLIAYLHIDEVIRIIRSAEDPRADLMTKFLLSDIQANDILEIRLRQLANLEQIKLEREKADLGAEADFLKGLLSDPSKLKAQILKEIADDRKKYGDDRRTLIEPAERITVATVAPASDDPVTLIVSKLGWMRARVGHKVDLTGLTWKPGDELLSVFETRTNQTMEVLDAMGRGYNIAASAIPNGRGDGIPLSTLIDIGANKFTRIFMLKPAAFYLLSSTGGYGFICPGEALLTRQKAGKVVMTIEAGEAILEPIEVEDPTIGEILVASSAGKLLIYPLDQVKQLAKGRGVQLIALGAKDSIVAVQATQGPVKSVSLCTLPTAKRKRTEILIAEKDLSAYQGKRARAGGNLPDQAIVIVIEAVAGSAPVKVSVVAAGAAVDFGDSDLI